MKYKEFVPKENYQFVYKWYLTDVEAGEFETCEHCKVEVPLCEFNDNRDTIKLCQICASTVGQDKQTNCGPLNVFLIISGAFDDIEVLFPDGTTI